MSRNTLLGISLLLLFFLVSSARRQPGHAADLAQEAEDVLDVENIDMSEVCEGDDKDCLMRRTLIAHEDYIYTNGTKA